MFDESKDMKPGTIYPVKITYSSKDQRLTKTLTSLKEVYQNLEEIETEERELMMQANKAKFGVNNSSRVNCFMPKKDSGTTKSMVSVKKSNKPAQKIKESEDGKYFYI